jgi:hypothetical protein
MTNTFVTTEHTQVLQKLIQEVVNDPTTYLGSKYLPSIALPVREIYTEVVEATGGLTNEHVIGTDPKYIRSFGTRVQKFEPPAFKESIHYDEKKILHLRQLGQNDRSMRGIRQYIDKDVDRLNRRLEARIEKLRWDAIFTGGFSYMGETFSYGIPALNQVTPLGADWSLDGIGANNAANPIVDIRYWTTGGNARFRKYKITKMIMNGNTARWLLDNSEVRGYIQNAFANPNLGQYDINTTLQFFIPGCPPVEIYNGWYQTESVDGDDKIVVSDAIFFVPDGYIFFEASLPGGDMIGEFVQGVHLASGSIDDPGFGKFLVIEENVAPGTKGGPKNPYIDITAGVYGGAKLDRPFDVLTAKVYG